MEGQCLRWKSHTSCPTDTIIGLIRLGRKILQVRRVRAASRSSGVEGTAHMQNHVRLYLTKDTTLCI